MNYKYSTINPTINKELYMYSGYHGVEFVKAYKLNRNTTIKKCLEKLQKIKDKEEITDKILNFFMCNKYKQEETTKLFLNLLKNKFNIIHKDLTRLELNKTIDDLDYLFNKASSNKILEKSRIDNLVKKFEIKKSFTGEINALFSNTVLQHDIDETYHLIFSFLISKYFIVSNLLKYLSVLLKLNDLLIYRLYNEECINIDLLSCSILLELNFFYELEEATLGN